MVDMATALEALSSGALYAALLVAVGACATRWLVIPPVRRDLQLRDPIAGSIQHSVAGIGLIAAAAALTADIIRVWTHAVAVFGWSDSFSWDSLRVIAFESRWGIGWRPQAMSASAAVVAYLWTRARARSGWPIATVATAATCFTLPLLGHAAGSRARLFVHAVHVLGAGVWLGTLATVWMVGLEDETFRRALLKRFAPVALSGIGTLALAGIAASWLYVGAISNLWSTTYGQVLVVKVALFLTAFSCGYFNWRQLRAPAMPVRDRLPIVTLEVSVGITIVLITGLLTELAHP
jgi:putative copper export protein